MIYILEFFHSSDSLILSLDNFLAIEAPRWSSDTPSLNFNYNKKVKATFRRSWFMVESCNGKVVGAKWIVTTSWSEMQTRYCISIASMNK
jgi:hypothetical protein